MITISKKTYGLRLNTVNMDEFIRINGLQECTDPIMMMKNVPTEKGILSYEIFGMSSEDRKHRMAYIDLKGKYMFPIAAKKLKAYDNRLSNILFSLKKYKFSNGDLILDDEGETGPDFLYKIWGKVKTKEKDTIITKEVESFFKRPREKLFIDKFLVIPPATRDINTAGGGMGTNIINKKYCAIISFCQNMSQYTDSFSDMRYITRSRIQTLLIDIYDELIINKIKGDPAKYGMLRRHLMSKNIDYSTRIIITASDLFKETVDDVNVKFSYLTLPLPYICSIFMPFVAYHIKQILDNELVRSGTHHSFIQTNREELEKRGVDPTTIQFEDSIDEVKITDMILKFINSPISRFDKILIPITNSSGKVADMPLKLTGRFMKTDATFSRAMTLTDLMYIAASRAVEDKHCFVTRFPVTTYNSRFGTRIIISSTQQTTPVMIGENVYQFFPVIEGDPENAFSNSAQFSNAYLIIIGGDFDGDQVSITPVFSIEANAEVEDRIHKPSYIVDVKGEIFTKIERDFILTAFNLTHIKDAENVLKPISTKNTKYSI